MSSVTLPPLLARQLQAAFGRTEGFDPELQAFLDAVRASYDRRMPAVHADQAAWQDVLGLLPATYLHVNTAGRIEDCGGASGHLCGRPHSEWLGRSIAETVLAGGSESILAATAAAHRDLAPAPTCIETGDGESYCCLEGHCVPLADGSTLAVLQDVTTARLAQRAEQETSNLFSATLDSLPAQVAILDRDGSIIATNRSWDCFSRNEERPRFHGWNYLAVCKQSASAGCKDAAAVYAGLGEVLKGREPEFRYQYSSQDLPTRHFTLHAVRLTAACLGSVVISHEETTSTVRSEQYSRLQEKLLRTVLRALPVGVFVFDQEGRLLITNPAGSAAWGGVRCRGSSRDPHFPSTVGPAGAMEDGLGASVVRALGTGTSTIDTVSEVVGHDEVRRIINNSVLAIRGEQEQITGCVMVNQDMTERARAAAAVEQSERLHRAILDSVADGIVVTADDGSIAFINRTGELLLDRTNTELVGRRPEDALGSELGSLFSATPGVRESSFRRTDGRQRTYEFASAQIHAGPAKPQGAVVSFRDVTQRKDLQSQLAQSQKLEAIGQLAAGIAHEINTPTQYIGDNVRFLRDAFNDIRELLDAVDAIADAPEFSPTQLSRLKELRQRIDFGFLRKECPLAINQSLDGVERVTKIVYSMKDFAHPDREEKQAVDLNRVVTSATTVCRNEWKYVAELDLQLDPQLPTIVAYAGDLGQVVLNLVVNAAHAIAVKVGDGAKGKGRIVVRTRRTPTHVQLQVEDDGGGIAMVHRPRIFEQFFTTKPVGKGTGQGLALVRRIVVERHGGTVGFETEEGKGTTFSLTIPLGQ